MTPFRETSWLTASQMARIWARENAAGDCSVLIKMVWPAPVRYTITSIKALTAAQKLAPRPASKAPKPRAKRAK